MLIKNESEILNEEKRKAIIKEILGAENVDRKKQAFKAYECYKDKTKKYVIESLSKEMEPETVSEMKSRAANISIAKKIVNKKARVYKNSPSRKFYVAGEEDNKDLQNKSEALYELVNFDTKAKTLNRFYELTANTALQIVPIENDEGKYYIKVRALPEHLYDVVENANDPETPLIFITSPFVSHDKNNNTLGASESSHRGSMSSFSEGDGKNQMIADSPLDAGKEGLEFIWWSKSFHFTTNEKGQIINSKSPDNLDNPIGVLPFISVNRSQDGQYWSNSGSDLIDGSILINVLLTDLYFIAKVQGMGQFYYFGKNAGRDRKVGPNHGFFVELQEGDPTPQIGFATSNPPINDHMAMIEQYVAMLISTNDLSVDMVAGSLTAANAVSGIQQLISRSEVTNAIEDEQQLFLDMESSFYEIIKKWHNLYFNKKLLQEDFNNIGSLPEDAKVSVKYSPYQEFTTEQQRLDIIKQRLELGLDDIIEANMRDNPDLGEEEAEKRALRIAERKSKMSIVPNLGVDNGSSREGNQES